MIRLGSVQIRGSLLAIGVRLVKSGTSKLRESLRAFDGC